IAFGALVAGNAMAADMAVKSSPPPLLPPQPFSWTGFYIGGHIGAGWGTKEWDATSATNGGTSVTLNMPANLPMNGYFLGGGQLGYRWQFTNWVFGIEGSFSGTDIDARLPCIGTGQELVCSTKADWLATVTGQVGWAWDRALFYFKGGAAWIRDKNTLGFQNLVLCQSGTNCNPSI